MRCFIAINLPERVKKEIEKIQESLPEFKGKKTEPENLHLTLKFLGEIGKNDVLEVMERLRRVNINEFEAEIDSLGFFDNRKSRKYDRQMIVWLHMTNCDLLQREIDNALEEIFEKENRFMSHITIARAKGMKDKNIFTEKIKGIKPGRISLNIRDFFLIESKLREKGPKYD